MRFTKMHGAGNSFLLTEALRGELQGEDLHDLALRLCSPSTGPGADGMIVLVPGGENADVAMLFYNSDGSVGEMCGNGARCVARYAAEHGLARDPQQIRIRAAAGLVLARRLDDMLYEIRLNDPSVIETRRLITVGGQSYRCVYTELGDPGIPHAVTEVPSAAFDDLPKLREAGRALRFSPAFPKGANVSFVCVTGPALVRAVTYERGVEDFTLACGTGCGAIALAMALTGRIAGDALRVDMPGGQLFVRLRREGRSARDLWLTGPTAVVGEYDL